MAKGKDPKDKAAARKRTVASRKVKANPNEKLGKKAPWRPPVWTKEKGDDLAPQLLEWALTDDAWVLEEWLGRNGLYYETCCKLCERSPLFQESINAARQIIGARRERLAMEGKADAGIVKKTAPLYSKTHANWELKLRGMDSHTLKRALNVICRGIEDGELNPDGSEDKSE